MDEAAGLNGACETAYHGLIHCGNLRKGKHLKNLPHLIFFNLFKVLEIFVDAGHLDSWKFIASWQIVDCWNGGSSEINISKGV